MASRLPFLAARTDVVAENFRPGILEKWGLGWKNLRKANPGVVPKLSATPGRVEHLGPRLGEGNARIYGGLLGLSEEEIAGLKGKGVI